MAISRERQHIGYLIGACVGVTAVVLLLSPELQSARAKGPMNRGHESLTCESCHLAAPGTTRQQIQANIAYLLGTRKSPADFGYEAVGNDDCLACHERPNDRHPVFRFLEPRFADARREVGAHQCMGCHAEHRGTRVTNDGTFCRSCHERFEMDADPATPSHQELADQGVWQSCLRCHDFHGNHVKGAPGDLDEAAPEGAVHEYLMGGDSPYGEARRFRAREARP